MMVHAASLSLRTRRLRGRDGCWCSGAGWSGGWEWLGGWYCGGICRLQNEGHSMRGRAQEMEQVSVEIRLIHVEEGCRGQRCRDWEPEQGCKDRSAGTCACRLTSWAAQLGTRQGWHLYWQREVSSDHILDTSDAGNSNQAHCTTVRSIPIVTVVSALPLPGHTYCLH
jgi:hypothetical protein